MKASATAAIFVVLGALPAAQAGAACMSTINSGVRSFEGTDPADRSFIWTATIFDPLYFPSYYPLDYQAPFTGGLTASFWVVGSGIPGGPDTGDDSGLFDILSSGGLAYGVNGGYQVYYAAQLDTDWMDPAIDGCIEPDECTCLLLEDVDPFGRDGFFAVIAAKSDLMGDTSFHLDGEDPLGNALPIVLRPIPAPTVTAVDRPQPGVVELTVTVPGRTAGGYTAESGTGCTCGPTGFDVYQQVITRSGDWAPPAGRDLTAWTLSVPVGGGTQTTTAVDGSITVTVTCPTPADERIYLATRLFFDSGFSTGQVSANSIGVDCEASMPSLPDDLRSQVPTSTPGDRTPR